MALGYGLPPCNNNSIYMHRPCYAAYVQLPSRCAHSKVRCAVLQDLWRYLLLPGSQEGIDSDTKALTKACHQAPPSPSQKILNMSCLSASCRVVELCQDLLKRLSLDGYHQQI